MKLNDVDTYIGNFTGVQKERLRIMRMLVKKLSEDAVESFSYGLIGYKLNGKPLVYFGSFPNHTGFYATPNGHEAFKAEFSKYKQGKGSVQFPHDQPLPVALIEKVIRYRIEQCKI